MALVNESEKLRNTLTRYLDTLSSTEEESTTEEEALFSVQGDRQWGLLEWPELVDKWETAVEIEALRPLAESRRSLVTILAKGVVNIHDCDTSRLIQPLRAAKYRQCAANWIRLRLMTGTSSLNGMMFRMTQGVRSKLCPSCNIQAEETPVHFLDECPAHAAILREFWSSYRPPSQSDRIEAILGLEVDFDWLTPEEINSRELKNVSLIHQLWTLRKKNLTISLASPEDSDSTSPEEDDETESDGILSDREGSQTCSDSPLEVENAAPLKSRQLRIFDFFNRIPPTHGLDDVVDVRMPPILSEPSGSCRFSKVVHSPPQGRQEAHGNISMPR